MKFPARLSDVAKSLLAGLLTKDPVKRCVNMVSGKARAVTILLTLYQPLTHICIMVSSYSHRNLFG